MSGIDNAEAEGVAEGCRLSVRRVRNVLPTEAVPKPLKAKLPLYSSTVALARSSNSLESPLSIPIGLYCLILGLLGLLSLLLDLGHAPYQHLLLKLLNPTSQLESFLFLPLEFLTKSITSLLSLAQVPSKGLCGFIGFGEVIAELGYMVLHVGQED
ncbi:hypothetical protein NE237_028396 [Protea cynaroides]|uniref:Uncharacterized protein n=1 Tax=Protea cynaroides TaxID=273540 RepID=A0A9Q0GTQ2_9MAGN|nr:hypothetical protein NE237_028396 [Protea cynaroides]